jgi:hypothetical protein
MNLAGNPNRTGPRTCCARLRWKGMFIDVEPDLEVPNARDGFCWCSLTQTCLGPDGRVADEARCGGGRGCFEEL